MLKLISDSKKPFDTVAKSRLGEQGRQVRIVDGDMAQELRFSASPLPQSNALKVKTRGVEVV
ncbi:MAG: hypothetical protein IPJ95_09120 [Gemmatimonadetes bacterium]|nr:hypothetical protein [Gemmatimonadota bacterium]MBK9069114.1 hypothetical protein [Gemmatimonadota bacterium]